MAYGGRQGSGGGDASAWDRHKRAAGGAANSTPQPGASPARDTHLVADGSRGLRCSQLGHRCLLAAGMGVRNAPCAPAPGPPRAAGRAPPLAQTSPPSLGHQRAGAQGDRFPGHLGERLLVVLQHGSAPGQQPGTLQGQRHVRQLELQRPGPSPPVGTCPPPSLPWRTAGSRRGDGSR